MLHKKYNEPRIPESSGQVRKLALEKHRNKIENIILFGSVARARENSDIVIYRLSTTTHLNRLISEIVVKILLETGISAKVISSEEYNLLKEVYLYGIIGIIY